jgi:hypothetical protein
MLQVFVADQRHLRRLHSRHRYYAAQHFNRCIQVSLAIFKNVHEFYDNFRSVKYAQIQWVNLHQNLDLIWYLLTVISAE